MLFHFLLSAVLTASRDVAPAQECGGYVAGNNHRSLSAARHRIVNVISKCPFRAVCAPETKKAQAENVMPEGISNA